MIHSDDSSVQLIRYDILQWNYFDVVYFIIITQRIILLVFFGIFVVLFKDQHIVLHGQTCVCYSARLLGDNTAVGPFLMKDGLRYVDSDNTAVIETDTSAQRSEVFQHPVIGNGISGDIVRAVIGECHSACGYRNDT